MKTTYLDLIKLYPADARGANDKDWGGLNYTNICYVSSLGLFLVDAPEGVALCVKDSYKGLNDFLSVSIAFRDATAWNQTWGTAQFKGVVLSNDINKARAVIDYMISAFSGKGSK